MKKAAYWVVCLVCVAALGVGVIMNRTSVIPTGKAALHEFSTFIEGVGMVSAPTQVVLVPAGGTIASIVAEGQRVRAGDSLLRIDDESLRLQVQEAVLALNAQKKAATRQDGQMREQQQNAAMMEAQTIGADLQQFNSAATNTVQVGKEQVDIARLRIQQAKNALANASVQSVLNGTVLSVDLRAGEQAAAGTQALLVASMDELQIHSVFADADAAQIQPDMPVELQGGCLGDAVIGGVVVGIGPRAETQQTQTGTRSAAMVKIKPDDVARFSRLGASVELKIITGRKRAVGVPLEALAQDSSGLYVFVLRSGRAYKTPVELGVLDESYAQVVSGVAENDLVALNPSELRNGQKVSG